MGWLKRGPSGIIGTNLVDAEETAGAVAEDAEGLVRDRGGQVGADGLVRGRGGQVGVRGST